MEVLYLLIPLSALLVLAIIGVFGWALHRGQFDDLEREGLRILERDGDAAGTSLDDPQAGATPRAEQSPATSDGQASGAGGDR